jgi:hypothetical protein
MFTVHSSTAKRERCSQATGRAVTVIAIALVVWMLVDIVRQGL